MADNPPTPWQRANAQKKSRRQEERNARLPGGRKQVNSGRHWFSKKDNRIGGFLVESRTTDKNSYSITVEDWQILSRSVCSEPGMLLPAMQIDIKDLQLFVCELSTHMQREQTIQMLEDEIERLKGVIRGD